MFLVILALVLVVYCDAEKWLCPINQTKNFYQIHCKEESDLIREHCYSEHVSLMNAMTSDGIIELKISECDRIVVQISLSYYQHLRSLDISDSGYEDFRSFNLVHDRLKKLNASKNKLNEIPVGFFQNIPEVTEVDFSQNELITIYFVGADKLISINLAINYLTLYGINPFAGLIDLEYLDLSDNVIGELFKNFEENQQLKVLHLENNLFFSAPRVPYTTSVYISWNIVWNLNALHLDEKIRIILDNQIEGYLRTNNGYTELHCNDHSFEELNSFVAIPDQIENVHDLLICLGPSLEKLELPGNFIGEISLTTFSRFGNLTKLNLRNSTLKDFDVRNLFAPSLKDIELSNNFIDEVDANTFNRMELQILNLTNSHLSKFEISKNLHELWFVNISHNRLTELNFKISMEVLETIDLEDNYLVELVNFTRAQLPELNTLAIANNNFSCEYLTKLIKQTKIQWTDLKFVGDSFNQKHGKNCSSHTVNELDINGTTEENTSATSKEQNVLTEESKNTSLTLVFSLVIGISIVVVISVTGMRFAFRVLFLKKTTIEVSPPKNVEQIEMSPLSTVQPDEDVEHIYEEINPNEYAYDHLRFGLISISNDNHYHNFTLLNRESQGT